MKTSFFICFLFLSCFAHAQWQYTYTFPNPIYAFITCSETLYVGLGGGGVFRSQDRGETWIAVNNGIQFGGAYIFSLTSRNDSIYAGGFGEVCFSDDRGENWSLFNLNLSLNSFVYALIIKENYLFAGVGNDNNNGVYRKQLDAPGWTKMSNGLEENSSVNSFVIHDNKLFAGTDAGVYVSTNNGIDWNLASSGIDTNLSVKSLFTIKRNIIAGTNDGIFFTTNNGTSWHKSSGLPANSVVTCFTGNDRFVIAGTYGSVYASSDNGVNWVKINEGLDSIISFYSLTSLGDFFYGGTGAGITTMNTVLKFDYNALSHFVDDNTEEWLLYPNPVSEELIIKMPVSSSERITVSVFDLTGKLLLSKVFDNYADIRINTFSMNQGLYIIEIQYEEVTRRQKFVKN